MAEKNVESSRTLLEVSVPVREDSNRRRRIEIQGASRGGSSVH